MKLRAQIKVLTTGFVLAEDGHRQYAAVAAGKTKQLCEVEVSAATGKVTAMNKISAAEEASEAAADKMADKKAAKKAIC